MSELFGKKKTFSYFNQMKILFTFFIDFQMVKKKFDPIVLGTFEHEKVGKKKSHLSVEEVTVEFQALQTTIHVQKALK